MMDKDVEVVQREMCAILAEQAGLSRSEAVAMAPADVLRETSTGQMTNVLLMVLIAEMRKAR